MKLPETDSYLSKGIKMRRQTIPASYGLFYSRSAQYEYRTVFDLEEAVRMNANEGWFFEHYDTTFANLSLYLWRDLKYIKD